MWYVISISLLSPVSHRESCQICDWDVIRVLLFTISGKFNYDHSDSVVLELFVILFLILKAVSFFLGTVMFDLLSLPSLCSSLFYHWEWEMLLSSRSISWWSSEEKSLMNKKGKWEMPEHYTRKYSKRKAMHSLYQSEFSTLSLEWEKMRTFALHSLPFLSQFDCVQVWQYSLPFVTLIPTKAERQWIGYTVTHMWHTKGTVGEREESLITSFFPSLSCLSCVVYSVICSCNYFPAKPIITV